MSANWIVFVILFAFLTDYICFRRIPKWYIQRFNKFFRIVLIYSGIFIYVMYRMKGIK